MERRKISKICITHVQMVIKAKGEMSQRERIFSKEEGCNFNWVIKEEFTEKWTHE